MCQRKLILAQTVMGFRIVNLGTGGWAEDITDTVKRDFVQEAEAITGHLGTLVGAVDFLYDKK